MQSACFTVSNRKEDVNCANHDFLLKRRSLIRTTDFKYYFLLVFVRVSFVNRLCTRDLQITISASSDREFLLLTRNAAAGTKVPKGSFGENNGYACLAMYTPGIRNDVRILMGCVTANQDITM